MRGEDLGGNPGGGGEGCPPWSAPRREVSRPKAVHIRGGRSGGFGGGTPGTDDHRPAVAWFSGFALAPAGGADPGRCRGSRRQGVGGVALLG
jgi:hypothetical protein